MPSSARSGGCDRRTRGWLLTGLALVAMGCRTRLPDEEAAAPAPDAFTQQSLPPCAGLRSTSPWPMYRGDARHTGRGRGRGPGGDHVRWTAQIGPAQSPEGWDSAPVIGPDGTVYAVDAEGRLVAVGPDGAVRWRTSSPGTRVFDTSPAVDADGQVYFLSVERLSGYCMLLALDAATGAERWRAIPACGAGIALAGDRSVYVGNKAWDGATGALRWTVAVDNSGYSGTPAIGDDCTVYIASDHVYAVNHADGSVKWVGEPPMKNPLAGSPVVGDDGTVFMEGDDRALYALDGATGHTRWKLQTTAQIRADVALGPDGTVYFSSEAPPDRTVSALDPKTGAVKWSVPMARWSLASSPVVDADGTVYLGTGSGIRLFALDGNDGHEHFHVNMATDSTHGPILGDEGVLYQLSIGTLTKLAQ